MRVRLCSAENRVPDARSEGFLPIPAAPDFRQMLHVPKIMDLITVNMMMLIVILTKRTAVILLNDETNVQYFCISQPTSCFDPKRISSRETATDVQQ